MNLEDVKQKDTKYTEYEKEGFHYWNSYNTKPETEQAIKNLHRWGSKTKVIHYPNGTYVVMRKE